jgi:RNA polymerase sigma-70 factor, ECF subfamily
MRSACVRRRRALSSIRALLQNGRVQRTKDHAEPELPPGTLGDILYATAPTSLVSEKSWVDLVQAVAGGEQMALHALYERAHRVVFTLTMRITGSRETAEELTVDVFHDVWRRASSYDPANGTVLGWIMNQARSRAIDRLRFDQRKKRIPGAIAAEPGMEPRDPQHFLQGKQQGEVLQRALRRLAPGEREAIEAAFFSELTYTEVADRLHQPVGTIKTRIRSGLIKLRDALGAEARPS